MEQPGRYGPAGRSPWLDIDWREHQRWVLVEGQAVNMIELGEGPPIVFVHGLSGSWTNWLEQRDYRVHALDFPGFGSSSKPATAPYNVRFFADTVVDYMDALNIGSAHFVGNSMGGFIGAELAIAFPQRVERLVLVSAAGLSTYNEPRATRATPALRRTERILAATTAWMASHSDAVTRRPRLRQAALNVVAAHPKQLPGPLAAEQVRGAGKPGFMGALGAVLEYDVRERLPEIACPTLIVWGDRDMLISVRDADVFAELIPNSRKVIYADTGHVAMLERPAPFNALLREFLAE